jgi:hypothetical protein
MPEYKAEQVREAVTLYRELHKDTVNNDADALAEIALEWLQFNTDSNDPEFNLELEQEEQ